MHKYTDKEAFNVSLFDCEENNEIYTGSVVIVFLYILFFRMDMGELVCQHKKTQTDKQRVYERAFHPNLRMRMHADAVCGHASYGSSRMDVFCRDDIRDRDGIHHRRHDAEDL